VFQHWYLSLGEESIALLKVLYRKTRHITNYTCLAKNLIFFSECAAINVRKCEGRMLVVCFGGTNSQWIVPFMSVKQINMVFIFDFDINTVFGLRDCIFLLESAFCFWVILEHQNLITGHFFQKVGFFQQLV
jgi:hypothetical protein